jgi:hypothetical protein
MVSVLVPKPRGLEEVSRDELVERATRLAHAALETAAAALLRCDQPALSPQG